MRNAGLVSAETLDLRVIWLLVQVVRIHRVVVVRAPKLDRGRNEPEARYAVLLQVASDPRVHVTIVVDDESHIRPQDPLLQRYELLTRALQSLKSLPLRELRGKLPADGFSNVRIAMSLGLVAGFLGIRVRSKGPELTSEPGEAVKAIVSRVRQRMEGRDIGGSVRFSGRRSPILDGVLLAQPPRQRLRVQKVTLVTREHEHDRGPQQPPTAVLSLRRHVEWIRSAPVCTPWSTRQLPSSCSSVLFVPSPPSPGVTPMLTHQVTQIF